MRSKVNQKGFTLIELLIVITIIGILAVAFLPSLLGAPARARDTQRLASMNKLQSFFASEGLSGTLPAASDCLDPGVTPASPPTTAAGLVVDNLADLGGVFPTDPNDATLTTGSTGSTVACAAGEFVFVRYGAANDFSAAVVTTVEDTDNGNINCNNAGLDDGGITAPALGDTGTCFAALIQ